MLLNCGVGEDSWESLGLQGDPTSPSYGDQSWIFIGRTDTEADTPILWPPDAKSQLIRKDPDAGKDWRQEEKGMTGWDGWMASLTPWTWVWASSGIWWRTRKPGVLQSMGSQRVRHDWHDLAAAAPWKKSYDKPRQHIKKQRHYFANKVLSSQSYDFSSMDVRVGP